MQSLLNDTVAYLCNAHGQVLWRSHDGFETQIGDYVWSRVCDDQVELVRNNFFRAARFKIPQTGEGKTNSGHLFRGWAWGLNSPEYAVCCLFVALPSQVGLLSSKEREIMICLGAGQPVKRIAKESDISISTVHTHLRRIREKLGVHSHESVIGFAGRYMTPLRSGARVAENETLEMEGHTEPSCEFSQTLASLPGTHAMICDWQGKVIWQSQSGIMTQVGDLIWQYVRDDYRESVRSAVARCVTLGEAQTGETFNQRDEYFRIFSWPLMSPDAAMFVLLVRLPEMIADLTEREREVVNFLGSGVRAKEIAEILDLGTTTVHAALKSAREKLGLENQESLIGFAARYCVVGGLPLSKD